MRLGFWYGVFSKPDRFIFEHQERATAMATSTSTSHIVFIPKELWISEETSAISRHITFVGSAHSSFLPSHSSVVAVAINTIETMLSVCSHVPMYQCSNLVHILNNIFNMCSLLAYILGTRQPFFWFSPSLSLAQIWKFIKICVFELEPNSFRFSFWTF